MYYRIRNGPIVTEKFEGAKRYSENVEDLCDGFDVIDIEDMSTHEYATADFVKNNFFDPEKFIVYGMIYVRGKPEYCCKMNSDKSFDLMEN